MPHDRRDYALPIDRYLLAREYKLCLNNNGPQLRRTKRAFSAAIESKIGDRKERSTRTRLSTVAIFSLQISPCYNRQLCAIGTLPGERDTLSPSFAMIDRFSDHRRRSARLILFVPRES